jgi:hypothetical protein
MKRPYLRTNTLRALKNTGGNPESTDNFVSVNILFCSFIIYNKTLKKKKLQNNKAKCKIHSNEDQTAILANSHYNKQTANFNTLGA